MGLDVYLHRFDDFDDAMRRERLYEAESEEIWSFGGRGYDDLTDAEKDAARTATDAIAARLGLGKYGEGYSDKVERPSAKYPEHYFKIGYFRSSYNESGINRVLRNLGVPDLYAVFAVDDGHEAYISPDWHDALERATAVLCGYNDAVARDGGRLFATFVGDKIFQSAKSPEEAIQIYRRVAAEPHGCGAFSNRDGDFWLKKPLPILAAIPAEHYSRSGAYLIGRYPAGDDDFYRQAIEIVIETIEWVLAQPSPEQFKLAWSA